MQHITERRYSVAQIRSANSSRTVSGIAARFNHLSEDLGGWRERLAPGSFRSTLGDGHDIKMFHSHDPARVLASTRTGSLQLNEGVDGLNFRAALPNTSDGDDVLELCHRGELEMSFGFRCLKDDWEDEDDPDFENDRGRRSKTIPVRKVMQAHLIEISSVAMPAYAGGATSIKPEAMAAAAAASRSLFPEGSIPIEIRSRLGLPDDPEWQALVARAQALHAKTLLAESIKVLR